MNLIYRAFIYDFLYVLADSLIKKHNPCNIQVSRSGLATCNGNLDVCCGECKYLSIRGCTVACLGCKLAICRKSESFTPDVSTKLLKMLDIAYTYTHLIDIRTTRQETLQYLKGLKDAYKARKNRPRSTYHTKDGYVYAEEIK